MIAAVLFGAVVLLSFVVLAISMDQARKGRSSDARDSGFVPGVNDAASSSDSHHHPIGDHGHHGDAGGHDSGGFDGGGGHSGH